MTATEAPPSRQAMNFQIGRVLEARDYQVAMLHAFGNESRGYIDAQQRVQVEEAKLTTMTLRYFEIPGMS